MVTSHDSYLLHLWSEVASLWIGANYRSKRRLLSSYYPYGHPTKHLAGHYEKQEIGFAKLWDWPSKALFIFFVQKYWNGPSLPFKSVHGPEVPKQANVLHIDEERSQLSGCGLWYSRSETLVAACEPHNCQIVPIKLKGNRPDCVWNIMDAALGPLQGHTLTLQVIWLGVFYAPVVSHEYVYILISNNL